MIKKNSMSDSVVGLCWNHDMLGPFLNFLLSCFSINKKNILEKSLKDWLYNVILYIHLIRILLRNKNTLLFRTNSYKDT